MAKFHINKNGEVKPCRAKVKCRFGGKSGSENHFNDRSKAEETAQKLLSSQYGPKMNGVSRTPSGKTTPAVAALESLQGKGYVVTTVTSVRDHSFPTDPHSGSHIDVLGEGRETELVNEIRSGKHLQFA